MEVSVGNVGNAGGSMRAMMSKWEARDSARLDATWITPWSVTEGQAIMAEREALRILAETEPAERTPKSPYVGARRIGRRFHPETPSGWADAMMRGALAESLAAVLPVLDEMEADARREAR